MGGDGGNAVIGGGGSCVGSGGGARKDDASWVKTQRSLSSISLLELTSEISSITFVVVKGSRRSLKRERDVICRFVQSISVANEAIQMEIF